MSWCNNLDRINIAFRHNYDSLPPQQVVLEDANRGQRAYQKDPRFNEGGHGVKYQTHKLYKENNADPPSVALLASPSSSISCLSSNSSPSAAENYAVFENDSRQSGALYEETNHSHSVQFPSLQAWDSTQAHHNGNPNRSRGMILATPPHRRRHAAGVSQSPEIISPPAPYRVTANPRRPQWTPFVAGPRFAYQQQQQYAYHRGGQPQMGRSWTIAGPSFPFSPHQQEAGISPYTGQHCYPYNVYHGTPMPSMDLAAYTPEVIGHPSLCVYKLRLPPQHLHVLDCIIVACEDYARKQKNGWRTNLYSLTKQDLALVDVPGMLELAKPITEYISRSICDLYHANSIRVDRNQPHVLKYSENHTGVELHHDRCDVTANLMMSRSHAYVGGGTYIPDASQIVRLKFGEFLLHPGDIVHGGMDITNGTRYLMVLFAHLKN